MFSFLRCRSGSVAAMYCCMGLQGGFPRGGACCSSVCRSCVHASAMSSFLRVLIKDLSPIVWCRDWGSARTPFALCPVDCEVGGTPLVQQDVCGAHVPSETRCGSRGCTEQCFVNLRSRSILVHGQKFGMKGTEFDCLLQSCWYESAISV